MIADKSIFGYDPIIGCPFNDTEMVMVEEWRGFKVGMQVGFLKFAKDRICGEIIAVGENAKYLDGKPFIAFAVKVGNTIHFKTHRDIHHVI